MHVGQHSAPWLQFSNPVQRLGDVGVRWMLGIAQRIDDERIEAQERCLRSGRKVADVIALGKRANTEAETAYTSMLHVER